eukprot:jgi/Ulvmu1/5471/UM023_0007.1
MLLAIPRMLVGVLTCLCLLTLSSVARQPSMMLPDDVDDGNLDLYTNVPTIAPVIGVLTQPASGSSQSEANTSYFAASYAKYAEMGGARVVPVLCDSSKEELTELFGKMNGLIVPGGSQDLGPGNSYYDAMSLLTDLAMQQHDATGEVFPIHYTCLGWEAAAIKFSNDVYILSNFTGSLGVSAELTWTDAAATATVLQMMSPQLRSLAATQPLAYEAHHYGIWLPDFLGTELAYHWQLLSTTKDALGKVYVSTVQAKHYPFVAVQWHPEKAMFEFGHDTMPHSLPAKHLSQALSNQFIWWAQHSTHVFPEDELDVMGLPEYQAVPGPHHYFEQVYLFPFTPPK